MNTNTASRLKIKGTLGQGQDMTKLIIIGALFGALAGVALPLILNHFNH